MKYTLLIFCFISTFAKAQLVIDSTWTTITSKDSSRHLGLFATGTNSTTITISPDTLKVIMFCADTSLKKYTIPEHYEWMPWPNSNSNTMVDQIVTEHEEQSYSEALFWQKGYSVSSLAGSMYYLDANKNPLSKNIMVWMSVPDMSKWTDAKNATRGGLIIQNQ